MMATTSPAKRTAASGDGEIANKRARATVGDAASKCKAIAALFSENPLVAKNLLTSMMERSLAVPAEARHEVQHLLVATVADTIATMESWKQAAVSETNDGMMDLQAGITAMETEISEHRFKAAELGVVFAEKAKELEAAQAVIEEKSAAVKAQRAANRCQDKTYNDAATEFDRVVDAFDALVALRDRDEQHSKTQSISKIVTIGKSYDFDSTMIQLLPNALRRAERGPFDFICISSMEEKLMVKQVELNNSVEAHATAKESRAAAFEQLQAAEAEAKAGERTCSEAVFEAEAVQTVALQAEVTTSQRLRSQQSALDAAEAHASEVAATLAAFVAGPVATFKSLEAHKALEQKSAEAEPGTVETPAEAKILQREPETDTFTLQLAGA